MQRLLPLRRSVVFASRRRLLSLQVFEERRQLWDAEARRQLAQRESQRSTAEEPILVSVRRGAAELFSFPGLRGRTTPLDVWNAWQQQQQPSGSAIKTPLVAEVAGQPHDLTRVLLGSEAVVALSFHDFGSPLGRQTFWHSSAHLLGHALEQLRSSETHTALLCDGPALENGGFFYDSRVEPDRTRGSSGSSASQVFLEDRSTLSNGVSHAELAKLTATMRWMSRQAFAFERLEVSRDLALRMFGYNYFKLALLDSLAADATISLYRCGPFIDLCAGPHVPNTSLVR